jgi:hypothetical protein
MCVWGGGRVWGVGMVCGGGGVGGECVCVVCIENPFYLPPPRESSVYSMEFLLYISERFTTMRIL